MAPRCLELLPLAATSIRPHGEPIQKRSTPPHRRRTKRSRRAKPCIVGVDDICVDGVVENCAGASPMGEPLAGRKTLCPQPSKHVSRSRNPRSRNPARPARQSDSASKVKKPPASMGIPPSEELFCTKPGHLCSAQHGAGSLRCVQAKPCADAPQQPTRARGAHTPPVSAHQAAAKKSEAQGNATLRSPAPLDAESHFAPGRTRSCTSWLFCFGMPAKKSLSAVGSPQPSWAD